MLHNWPCGMLTCPWGRPPSLHPFHLPPTFPLPFSSPSISQTHGMGLVYPGSTVAAKGQCDSKQQSSTVFSGADMPYGTLSTVLDWHKGIFLKESSGDKGKRQSKGQGRGEEPCFRKFHNSCYNVRRIRATYTTSKERLLLAEICISFFKHTFYSCMQSKTSGKTEWYTHFIVESSGVKNTNYYLVWFGYLTCLIPKWNTFDYNRSKKLISKPGVSNIMPAEALYLYLSADWAFSAPTIGGSATERAALEDPHAGHT